MQRLEAVTIRLEAAGGGSRPVAAAAAPAGASAPPGSMPAPPASLAASSSLAAFDALVAGELARAVAAAKAAGGGVAAATELLEKAFRAERSVVAAVAACRQPAAPAMQKLLSPVSSAIQEGARAGGRGPLGAGGPPTQPCAR